jgi:hypothetical protein
MSLGQTAIGARSAVMSIQMMLADTESLASAM